MIHHWPSDVARKLNWYVYLYVDPADGTVFYVGKGRGNRTFTHLSDSSETRKTAAIKKIRARGQEPRIEILVHGLMDEKIALRVEAAAIDLIGLEKLTNGVRGWSTGAYGRMGVEQVLALYDPKPAKIVDPVILIRINQKFRYGMSPIELYDATRGVWIVGKESMKRKNAKYAFAIFDQVVQEVYQIVEWFPGGTTLSTRPPEELLSDDRWEFVGQLAPEHIRRKYLHKSVEFKAHSQNPIKYVNCDDY